MYVICSSSLPGGQRRLHIPLKVNPAFLT